MIEYVTTIIRNVINAGAAYLKSLKSTLTIFLHIKTPTYINAGAVAALGINCAIGAINSELDFVRQRIELRLRTAALLDKTDAFISNTERMLDQFEKDDEEWRRKGEKLGFDF